MIQAATQQFALVTGAGGFIGYHLVRALKQRGAFVIGVDLKHPEFAKTDADVWILGDLRRMDVCLDVMRQLYILAHAHQQKQKQEQEQEHIQTQIQIYQLAADMGGAGYVFTGAHDAAILHNSATINLNMLESLRLCVQEYPQAKDKTRIFYSSSACIYPEYNQQDPQNPRCEESSAYPAQPDSEYGWEKLFSERLYAAYARNYGISVRIARLHNVFGPYGAWQGGREKAPAALSRKIATLPQHGGTIDVWGDGEQTRSFLYINDCIEGILRLMQLDNPTSISPETPVNLGSEEMVTINQLVQMLAQIAQKEVVRQHIAGPQGVRGRNSDNRLLRHMLQWEPTCTLETGLHKTYVWIEKQVKQTQIQIRPENREDTQELAVIAQVITEAFQAIPHSQHNEQHIVDRLRQANALTVSLVAVDQQTQKIVGYVAVSPVHIHASSENQETTHADTQNWYGLGPIAVAPHRQKQGVGVALMQAALSQLRTLHAAGCVLLGNPAYYQRFGFVPADSLVLFGLPVEYSQKYFQKLCLLTESKHTAGVVQYHAAFDAGV